MNTTKIENVSISPTDLCWGAKEIAAAIGVDQRAAYWLLENERLPAKKVGRTWVASRAKLLNHLVG